MKIIIIALAIVIGGCSGISRIELSPHPNTCQISHVQPSAFGAYGSRVCWDHEGKTIGSSFTKGKSVGEAVINALQIGTLIGSLVGLIQGLD